jgi:hypothetical protein
MTTIYCSRSDVEAVLGAAGVVARIDDNETGTASTGEDAYVTSAIETAAAEMNADLERQYILSQLSASNGWLKRSNALLAAEVLMGRRGNPVQGLLVDQVQRIREQLRLIGMGRANVPEQSPSANHLPTVSTFVVEPAKAMPIRVDTDISVGSNPSDGRKRFPANSSRAY